MVQPTVSTGGGPVVKLAKVSVAPAATLTTTALGKAGGLPWEVIIPWSLLALVILLVAQAWLDGTIIHKREYQRLVDDLEKWQKVVAQLNPALGLAVGVIREKVTAETVSPDVTINVNPHLKGGESPNA